MNAFRDWLNVQLGADGGRAVQMILALLLVVLLLVGLAWLFRRFSGHTLTGGRGHRLSVVDAAPVDGRRRLILLRRDDVEHLVMIGGPNDLLVESRILKAPPTVAARPAAPASIQPPQTAQGQPVPRPGAHLEDEKPAALPRAIPGAATLASAVADAGAYVRARFARGGGKAAEPARRPPRPAVEEDDFDAPLGRPVPPGAVPPVTPPPPEALLVPPSAVEPPAAPRPRPAPAAPAVEVSAPAAPAAPPRVPPVPPAETMPRRRPVEQPAAPTSPVLPAVATVAATASAAAVTAAAIESALAAPSTPPTVEPSAVEPHRHDDEGEHGLGDIPLRPSVSPPTPPLPTTPATTPEIDLLSELDLVVGAIVRDEPAPPVADPGPAAATEPSAETRVEPHFDDTPTFAAPPVEVPPPVDPAPASGNPQLDELEAEMARLLAEISGQPRR